MIEASINRLNYLLSIIPSRLREIDEETFSKKPAPGKWSKKEILGHLIDSATNNHQRFVRGQFEHHPEVRYDQDQWNACSYYQERESVQIISFWVMYNQQLVEIIKRIPKEKLTHQVKVGDNLLTLEFIITDYVEHMEHHLKQIIAY